MQYEAAVFSVAGANPVTAFVETVIKSVTWRYASLKDNHLLEFASCEVLIVTVDDA